MKPSADASTADAIRAQIASLVRVVPVRPGVTAVEGMARSI